MIYKYQILREDGTFIIGDVVNFKEIDVKIISIVKIDTDDMIIYFQGIPIKELDE